MSQQLQNQNLIQQLLQQSQQPNDISAVDQAPQTITSSQVLNETDPNRLQPLEQQLQQRPDPDGDNDKPDFDSAINTLLQTLERMASAGQELELDKQAKAVLEMAQAIHYLAQASVQEGQHIPAQVQIRLQAAQLQMQQQQQNHDQLLARQQQAHQQAIDLTNQQHQHALDLAKAGQQNLQTHQQLQHAQEQHDLEQQITQQQAEQQQQQQEQQMQLQQQQAQQEQNQGGEGE